MSVALARVPGFSLGALFAGLGTLLKSASPFPALEVRDEFRPILAFAAPLLGAIDQADLDLQLERAVPGMLEIFRGLPEIELPDQSQANDWPEPIDSGPIANTLGFSVAKQMADTARDSIAASVRHQSLLSEMYNVHTPIQRRKLLLRVFSAKPARLHEGHVVPGRLLLSKNDQIKGTIALCALVSACVQRRKPEAWLSQALVDAWSDGVRACAWMVESLTESPDGHCEMSDIFREADEADADFVRQFEEDVRAGRTGIPLED